MNSEQSCSMIFHKQYLRTVRPLLALYHDGKLNVATRESAKVFDRALEILQERIEKRGHEIACRIVIAESGRGMSDL